MASLQIEGRGVGWRSLWVSSGAPRIVTDHARVRSPPGGIHDVAVFVAHGCDRSQMVVVVVLRSRGRCASCRHADGERVTSMAAARIDELNVFGRAPARGSLVKTLAGVSHADVHG